MTMQLSSRARVRANAPQVVSDSGHRRGNGITELEIYGHKVHSAMFVPPAATPLRGRV